MKKPTLIFFTFLILLANVATQYINDISGGSNIDSEGNQVFEIIIALAKQNNEPFEFEMTLQNSAGDEIKATCSYEPLEAEEEGIVEIPENEKEKEEKEKEPENEKGKAENEKEENEKGKPENENEKGKAENEKGKPENEKEKGKSENEKEKAENEKEKSENETEKEKSEKEKGKPENEKEKAENETEKEKSEKEKENEKGKTENEKGKAENEKEKEEKEKEKGKTENEQQRIRRIRRLPESIQYNEIMKCTLDSPIEKSGYYKINRTDNTDITFNDYMPPGIFLEHFYTQNEATERTEISLTFRQVSSFKNNSFKFYALTKNSLDSNYQISFLAWVTNYENIQKEEPVEIICTNENAVDVDPSLGIAAAIFNCSVDEDVQYLEIISSKDVAGIQNEFELLNPVITDEYISDGKMKDKSTSEIPALLKIDEDTIDYSDVSKGFIVFTFPLGNLNKDKIFNKTFYYEISYPHFAYIEFNIDNIIDTDFTLRGNITGKFDNIPLFFEQTIITVDEEELFVIPGFQTKPIFYSSEGDLDEDKTSDAIIETTHQEDTTSTISETTHQEDTTNTISETTHQEDTTSTISETTHREDTTNTISETTHQEDTTNTIFEKTHQEDTTNAISETIHNEVTLNTTSETTEQEVISNTTSENNEQEDTTNTTPETTHQEVISNTTSEIEGDAPRSPEQAEKKANITLSFRQINSFYFIPGTITFAFLGFTTQSLESDSSIKLFANLISIENGLEDKLTEFNCNIEEAVTISGAEIKQANFKCENNNLNTSIEYASLKLNQSGDIAGIPTDDDTALNPLATDIAIANGEVKNSAEDNSIPLIFTPESIEMGNCDTDGKFTIKGYLSENYQIFSTFTLPLTYPQGTSITCSFVDTNSIECMVDQTLEGLMTMEQTMFSIISNNENKESLLLESFSYNNTNCGNGLQIQAVDKVEVSISFRQVSHIERTANGLTFFFAAFANSDIPANTEIPMNVIVDQTEERQATCRIREAVTYTPGSLIQADFDCSLTLESDENVDPNTLYVSLNNDNIGGCSDLSDEEIVPYITDEAIRNSEQAESDLGLTLDYSGEENKTIYPPSFTLISIDTTRCNTRGKLRITGQFSENITEEMTFEIPFSFPSAKVRCSIDYAEANTDVEMTCKMQRIRRFFKFNYFVVEPKLIKKKSMEMLYIQKTTHQLDRDQECENYNDIRARLAQERRNSAQYTFIQIGLVTESSDSAEYSASYSGNFFIALTSRNYETEASLSESISFDISYTYDEGRRRRNLLRALDTKEEDNGNAKCTLKGSSTNSGVYDCKAENKPKSLDIIDPIIGGVPDNNKVPENPTPDYRNPDNLDKYNELPAISITSITSNNCSSSGKYIITGTIQKGELVNADNLTIPFATPDSSGLCAMNVNSKDVTFNCENAETFTSPDLITIAAQPISNKYNNETLFKISEDFSIAGFSCAISDNSLKNPFKKNSPTPDTSIPTSGPESKPTTIPATTPIISQVDRTSYKKNSSGLGGGAIAGIVIACVVAVAGVATFIALGKTGAFSKSKHPEVDTSVENSNTINKFKMDYKNQI